MPLSSMSHLNGHPLIQPSSPQKSPCSKPSSFTIEELPNDDDAEDRTSGVNVIYPDELEEYQSEAETDDDNRNNNNDNNKEPPSTTRLTYDTYPSSPFSDNDEDHNDDAIVARMRRLFCSAMTRQRRQRNSQSREGGPYFFSSSSPMSSTTSRKRTHSQSTLADTDTECDSAYSNQDGSPRSASRRLRRRVRGPGVHSSLVLGDLLDGGKRVGEEEGGGVMSQSSISIDNRGNRSPWIAVPFENGVAGHQQQHTDTIPDYGFEDRMDVDSSASPAGSIA